MSGTAWYEPFFGADYLEIYRDAFPAERTAAPSSWAVIAWC